MSVPVETDPRSHLELCQADERPPPRRILWVLTKQERCRDLFASRNEPFFSVLPKQFIELFIELQQSHRVPETHLIIFSWTWNFLSKKEAMT